MLGLMRAVPFFRPFRFCLGLGLALIAAVAAPADQTTFRAGDLCLMVARTNQGIAVERLLDLRENRELSVSPALPLFTLTLRESGSANEVVASANGGWDGCLVESGRRLELNWTRHTNTLLRGVSVRLTGTADARASAIRWALTVTNPGTKAGVMRVVFPQVGVADLGTNGAVLFPRGPGEVQRGVWSRPFVYQGNYPDGWCGMQFVAAYRENDTGLYVATHDPFGGTKQLVLRSDPAVRALRVSFEHPAPDMGVPGAGFELEGEAVWQLLRGDWFDAAVIYRDWVRNHAKWWPRLSREGRADTPRWARELGVWTMTGGAPGECVDRVRKFREFLGIPLGFHWYNWHEVPFDNDYPHYFPTKDGFIGGVAALKRADVYPMPYINGRLWDSHDRGAEDFQFSSVARQAVTKKEDGSPHLEQYGSKETNGQPVSLGVMCPSTPLWRNTVSNIVIRLLGECGTSSVYIDQVAAAAPKLCMDPTHGHPLGGGHWWTESYWRMLRDIRLAMPRGTMLTTECNAEPFIHCFDAYLTWHWQFDGQVPAFPAVYGGAIQTFGRAYRGGATKDLALRMKAAQQLVFGEQLGWLDPDVVKEPQNADFFRQLARIRAELSPYFYTGQMARPPRLLGDIPKLKADWQWSGEWWVTTDAVLTGAWTLPRERRTVLLFVNAGDEPVTAVVQDDRHSWRIRERALPKRLDFAGQVDPAQKADTGLRLGKAFTFPPRQVRAWEF